MPADSNFSFSSIWFPACVQADPVNQQQPEALGQSPARTCILSFCPTVEAPPPISSVQFCSVAQSCPTLTAACQTSLSITNSQSFFKLTPIESGMPSNHLILCSPFLPPSIFPSIRVFSNESALRIRWSNYWSFSLASVLPMNFQD